MKKLLILPVIFALLLTIGCVQAPVVPPLAMLYSDVEAPLNVGLHKTSVGSKEGTASCTSILGLFAFGDCSTRKAALNGGITTMTHADYSFTNILFFVQTLTVKVYGD